ncbi:MAG: hypothetical protein NTX25_08655, partial [Proteobacteria bacterium]|nr:hypothetical protein [Pseudomonadota bacterium]
MSHFNLCRYFLTCSISLIAMSGCNQFTVNRSHDFSKAVDVSSLGSKQISTIAGTAGVETAALSAGSAFTQELEASNASTISGTVLQFPPGSLSINTDISLEEGSAVATSSTASALNLGSSISNAGAAVVINSSAAVDPVQPFVLKINLGSGNLNLADATENLIVIYKVQIFAENRFVLGVLPRSALTIEGQKVSFSAQYFGVFQTAYAEKPVLEESKVTVAEAIQTKREAVTLPPPSFTSLELTHVAIDGVINEAEKSLTSPIWQLNASSYTEASFTEALDDSGKALLCDGTKAYKRLSIPTPAQLKTDGPLAICVRLTDAAGRIVYGKSQAIVRDTTPPNFISLAKSAAGADGFINGSEINQSQALWFLNASGYTSLGFSIPFMESALPHTCDANDNYRA